MRLIDADKLFQDLKEHNVPFNADINEAIIVAPTVDAVPLDDYKSMEQTVYKLTKAIADAELTGEQVKEYCRKRNLLIVGSEVFNEMKARWGAEPVRHGQWMRTDAYPHWIYCSECYAQFIRNSEFLKLEDIPHNFCPNCGAKMDEVEDGKT